MILSFIDFLRSEIIIKLIKQLSGHTSTEFIIDQIIHKSPCYFLGMSKLAKYFQI